MDDVFQVSIKDFLVHFEYLIYNIYNIHFEYLICNIYNIHFEYLIYNIYNIHFEYLIYLNPVFVWWTFNRHLNLAAQLKLPKQTAKQHWWDHDTYITYSGVFIGDLACVYTDRVIGWPTNVYLFKVNNRNTRKKCEIFSKLTIKIERRHGRRSGIFIVNFEYMSIPFSSVSVVFFEQVNVSWDVQWKVWQWQRSVLHSSKKTCLNGYQLYLFGAKYSRMGQVTFLEDSL